MIYQIMQNGLKLSQNLVLLAATFAAVLGALTIHELAHGFVSYMQGDNTAKNAGRLTLNPIKHIDPIGALCMLFAGIGWAKAVPVDTRYYKNPKKGMAFTALAGPFINFLIGVNTTVAVATLSWLWQTGVYEGFPILKSMTPEVYQTVYLVLYIVLYYNLLFAVFNMLPIPPFDGSRIVFALLPDKYYFGIMKYDKLIMVIVFLALWGGMFTGVFEIIVDGVIKLVASAVYAVLELATKI